MGKPNRKRTLKLAFSAMLSALGVVILYLGAVINVLDLTAVALTSLFVFFAVIELGPPFPYLIYAVTSLLSLLLLPDKFAALAYLLFGGIYPIFKEMFERLHFLIAWILKFSFFNTVLSLLIAGTVYLLHIEDTDLGFKLGVYALANLTFFLYDIATTQLVTFYLVKLRHRLRVEKFFGGRGEQNRGKNIDKPRGKE